MADNAITWRLGLDRSQITSGLRSLQSEVAGATGQITKGFTGMQSGLTQFGMGLKNLVGSLGMGLGIGALAAELGQVVEQAHEIHRESERFGIDSTQLQMIGNAAKEDGISLESTARAMSRMIFAEDEAIKKGGAMAQAFATLGISLGTFQSLAPDDKFYALADALKAAGLNTATFSAISEILGKRFGSELIPVLIQGSAAIKAQSEEMGIMGKSTVENLEIAHKAFKEFSNTVQVIVGGALAFSMKILRTEWISLKGAAIELKDSVVSGWHEMERAMHLDFAGSAAEFKKGLDKMKQDAIQTKNDIADVWKQPMKMAPGTEGQFDPDASKEGESAADKKAAKEREAEQKEADKERDKVTMSLKELAGPGKPGESGTLAHDRYLARKAEEENRRAEEARLKGRPEESQMHLDRAAQIEGGIQNLKPSENMSNDVRMGVDAAQITQKFTELIAVTKGNALS